ncbi:MAG: hypothetical protein LWX56_07855 [Ignavibacteria bacterium]|nr:hypothetical protein [Ignavibacteria bacterium]
MKKYIFLFLLFGISAFGQKSSSIIRLGYFDPKVSDGGFIIGYNWQRHIDERFDIGFEMDWFRKSYTDQKLVEEFMKFTDPGVDYEVLAKTSMHDFPLQFTMAVNFPLPRDLSLFAECGLGFDLLFVNYRSYTNPTDDNLKVAADFNRRLGVGCIYPLGSKSDLIFSLNYHAAEPSWDYEVTDRANVKHIITRKYDMSGVMARLGIRFSY